MSPSTVERRRVNPVRHTIVVIVFIEKVGCAIAIGVNAPLQPIRNTVIVTVDRNRITKPTHWRTGSYTSP